MKIALSALVCFCVALSFSWGAENPADGDKYWPQWRGPTGNGVAPGNDPPVEWSETKNVRWKTNIPGRGSSTPIIYGDRLFVTSAIPMRAENGEHRPQENGEADGQQPGQRKGRRHPRGIQPDHVQQFVLFAINRHDGKILWQKTLREEKPHQGTHMTGTWASNSAVTDGQHIYAYFGSRGLYCLDMDGNLIWERDFGDMDKRLSFGEGSSPVLHDDKIFILWDHQGPSYLYAVDKMTGKDVWKVDRDEITTWTTPLIVEHGGKHQIIASGTNKVRSYDVSSGDLIWETSGMTVNVIPMPVHIDGLVLVTSGFRGNALLAIRLDDAKGDITDTDAIVWKLGKDTPYAPSPLLYDDTIYFLKTNTAILSSFNAKTGEENYRQQRLADMGTVYSSPVGAAGRVYITDRDGNTTVIRHGSTFEVLAKNSLDDGFDASMAVVEDQIYMRGHSHLYCIAEER